MKVRGWWPVAAALAGVLVVGGCGSDGEQIQARAGDDYQVVQVDGLIEFEVPKDWVDQTDDELRELDSVSFSNEDDDDPELAFLSIENADSTSEENLTFHREETANDVYEYGEPEPIELEGLTTGYRWEVKRPKSEKSDEMVHAHDVLTFATIDGISVWLQVTTSDEEIADTVISSMRRIAQ